MRQNKNAGEPLLPDVVHRAICVAATAHRTQTRKASGLPYISHPAAVASILVQAGISDPNMIAAAWLHDVVEDTDVTLEDIAEQFPAEVVQLVDCLSEMKYDESGTKIPWAERKAHHIRKMSCVGVDAKAVMLADKLHNMMTMVDEQAKQPDFWDRFNASKADLLGYYSKMVATTAGIEELSELRVACEQLILALRGA